MRQKERGHNLFSSQIEGRGTKTSHIYSIKVPSALAFNYFDKYEYI